MRLYEVKLVVNGVNLRFEVYADNEIEARNYIRDRITYKMQEIDPCSKKEIIKCDK